MGVLLQMLAEARVKLAEHEERDTGDDQGYVEHGLLQLLVKCRICGIGFRGGAWRGAIKIPYRFALEIDAGLKQSAHLRRAVEVWSERKPGCDIA